MRVVIQMVIEASPAVGAAKQATKRAAMTKKRKKRRIILTDYLELGGYKCKERRGLI